ncbi:MAG: hypothetical protein ACRDTR_05345 [Rubrobacter sp.]
MAQGTEKCDYAAMKPNYRPNNVALDGVGFVEKHPMQAGSMTERSA